ncbi:peroxide stress protein YaaA [Rathayibacter sp. YIM 133350]|uniref:YaaA family protein n=1 Tax=Rathayibacter sp. YIM 133350 TaxID=3131992 RepID=UPI00307ECAB2
MRILLPPSETKRAGGEGDRLDVKALAFPALAPQRRALVRELRGLARDAEASAVALKLGATQRGEIEANRRLTLSPTMPAIERFTGVLFDGLDSASLTEPERAFAHQHLLVHSALFGPVAALDPIPAYRLSHDSRLPGISLKKHWSPAISRELNREEGLVLDLRSEGYRDLGPAPVREHSVWLRVLTEGEDGRRRALNHFNKAAKGRFTRALVREQHDVASVDELLDWAALSGWRLERIAGVPEELALIV